MRKATDDVRDILKSYSNRFSNQIEGYESMTPTDEAFSREYEMFRDEAIGSATSTYEKLTEWAGNIIKVQVNLISL